MAQKHCRNQGEIKLFLEMWALDDVLGHGEAENMHVKLSQFSNFEF